MNRIRRLRARVRDVLDREAKVRDLVKASLPLWASVVIGCGAGLAAISHLAEQREHDQQCQRVESRDQLRGVFGRLYDRLDLTFPDEPVLDDLRGDLDTLYPPLDPC